LQQGGIEMTKILNVKIQGGGEYVVIETDNDDDYKYIWLNADGLTTIVDMADEEAVWSDGHCGEEESK
jgi:hypothetical protein